MKNVDRMRVVGWLALLLFVFGLDMLVVHQKVQAQEQKAAQAAAQPAKTDAPPVVSDALHNKVRDVQWQEAKLVVEIQSAQAQVEAAKLAQQTINRDTPQLQMLQVELKATVDGAAKEAGLDPAKWHLDADNMRWVAGPQPEATAATQPVTTTGKKPDEPQKKKPEKKPDGAKKP